MYCLQYTKSDELLTPPVIKLAAEDVKKFLPDGVKNFLPTHVKNSLPCGCKITLPRTSALSTAKNSGTGWFLRLDHSIVGISLNEFLAGEDIEVTNVEKNQKIH